MKYVFRLSIAALLAASLFLISCVERASAVSGDAAAFPPGTLIVDVRTPEEFAQGHIPGAVLFPYDLIDTRQAEFAALVGDAGKDRPLVVYCRSGRRSAIARESLARAGYRRIVDFGAIDNWKASLER